MATDGQFYWPSVGTFVAAYGQFFMAANTDCWVLREGDRVEARRHGTVYHRGTIQDLMPAMGMFWIIDSRTGTRKLLDMTEYRIWALPVH